MDTRDYILLLSAICGVIMVTGGIFLLYKGVITLKDANKDTAIDIEFKKMMRITSHYPSLALFIIGWGFVISAIIFGAQPVISIKGHLKNVSDPSSVKIEITSLHGTGQASTDGSIDGTIQPNTGIYKIAIVVPGYTPSPYIATVTSKGITDRSITIGEINLTHVADKPTVNDNNIARTNVEFAPLNNSGSF